MRIFHGKPPGIFFPGVFLFLLPLLFSGCGAPPAEEPDIIVSAGTEQASYGLTTVTREDVTLTASIIATWVQSQEQTVSFDSGGRRIARVLVNPGDAVQKGDLLIELDDGNLQEQIDELTYRIAKNEQLLADLDAAQAFDEQSAYNRFVYDDPEIDDDDVARYQKNQEDIARQYRYQREDLGDELEFDRLRLEELNNRLSATRVYSSMDGTVYKVTERLEGTVTKKDEVVMTIVDHASGHFETNAPEYAAYFREGEAAPLKIVYSAALGNYEVTPLDRSHWEETQRFSVLSGPENEGIDVGTTGTITIELERRPQALSLPIGAVYYADGAPYVYTLDGDGLRQITWIKTGLTGDNRIEITSGLSEGDQVVYH